MAIGDINTGRLSMPFSSLEGFRLGDFDTACPITGMPCPEKIELVSRYVGRAGEDGVPIETSLYDRAKCVTKLTEYAFRADSSCEVATTGTCPTREKMSGSESRQVGVRGIRRLMNIFGL